MLGLGFIGSGSWQLGGLGEGVGSAVTRGSMKEVLESPLPPFVVLLTINQKTELETRNAPTWAAYQRPYANP